MKQQTLSLVTMLELLAPTTNLFSYAYTSLVGKDKIKELPFYSTLYNLTYGEQDAYHDEYLPIIEKYKTQDHLEMFAGKGVESYLLAKAFPEKKFTCADLNFGYTGSKFTLPNLEYVLADCVKDDKNTS